MAHYKLNRNAIDTSERENNGTVNGWVVATTDRFGKTNSAMDFLPDY